MTLQGKYWIRRQRRRTIYYTNSWIWCRTRFTYVVSDAYRHGYANSGGKRKDRIGTEFATVCETVGAGGLIRQWWRGIMRCANNTCNPSTVMNVCESFFFVSNPFSIIIAGGLIRFSCARCSFHHTRYAIFRSIFSGRFRVHAAFCMR